MNRSIEVEWISTKKELPNSGHVVIVASGVAYYENGVWYSVTAEDFPGKPIQWDVKWWMTIPEEPDHE